MYGDTALRDFFAPTRREYSVVEATDMSAPSIESQPTLPSLPCEMPEVNVLIYLIVMTVPAPQAIHVYATPSLKQFMCACPFHVGLATVRHTDIGTLLTFEKRVG